MKRRKKKRAMPAALRAYWAKRRGRKVARRRPRRRTKRARPRAAQPVIVVVD